MTQTEHDRCRIREFARWDRTMLEHERQHLSRYMASAGAYLPASECDGILHDLTDIDYLLRELAPRIEVS